MRRLPHRAPLPDLTRGHLRAAHSRSLVSRKHMAAGLAPGRFKRLTTWGYTQSRGLIWSNIQGQPHTRCLTHAGKHAVATDDSKDSASLGAPAHSLRSLGDKIASMQRLGGDSCRGLHAGQRFPHGGCTCRQPEDPEPRRRNKMRLLPTRCPSPVS